MKRIIGLAITLLVMYVIYYDLSHGTLPVAIEATTKAKTQEINMEQSDSITIDHFEKKVENGDTVLSIVEQELDRPLPVSIQEVISDFETLNNGIKPEQIQTGKTYRFPDYQEE